MKHKAQQEMVGFILIVVLVVVAAMVFLLISLRKPAVENQDIQTQNMLSSIIFYTTDCAIVAEPDFEDIGHLIKSCKQGRRCSNLNEMACNYLNETLKNVLDNLTNTDSQISAYQLDVFQNNSGNLIKIIKGNCTGDVAPATELIASDSGNNIYMRLLLCSN